MTTDDAKLACYTELPDRYVLTTTTTTLRHEIDAGVLENDLDALTELLIKHERNDDARYLIYEAIDVVSANLDAERTDR